MPGYKRKTTAEREAINERARAWVRPISTFQRNALAAMAKGPLARGRAGWGTKLEENRYWHSQTIEALVGRGLARIEGKQRMRAVITGKGRLELKR